MSVIVANPKAPAFLTAKIDLDAAKGVLDAIAARDGKTTPTAVVAEAKSPSSPIHAFFQWDDSKAAHAHRLTQARTLIGLLYMQPVLTAVGITVEVRAIPHITGEGGGYLSQETVAASPSLSVRLVEDYDRQLRSLHQRNLASLAALKGSRVGAVVQAIEDYLKQNP